jgi:hypothetical protein
VSNLTKGPLRFSAKAVEIDHLDNAIIIIEVDPSAKEIEVTIEGPTDAVDEVNPRVRGDELLIRGPKTDNTLSISGMRINVGDITGAIVNIGSGNIISGGSFVGGGVRKPGVNLAVKVPHKTAVHLLGSYKKATVGDIEADILIDSSTESETVVGKVANANIDLSSHASVKIKEVNGAEMIVNLTSQSTLEVESCVVRRVIVNFASGSRMKMGDCHVGRLNVDGSSNCRMNVAKIQGDHLIVDLSSNCQLHVAEGGVDAFTAELASNSKAQFDGSAETARLEAASNSHIFVQRVVGDISKRAVSNSTIKIGNR